MRCRLSRRLDQVGKQSQRRGSVRKLVRVKEELDEVRDRSGEGEPRNGRYRDGLSNTKDVQEEEH